MDYLTAYAKHFAVTDRVKLHTKVVNISRDPAGGHLVSYISKPPDVLTWDTNVTPTTFHADYVAVCTGLHVVPSIPTVDGIEHMLKPRDTDGPEVERKAFHSAEYKTRSQLAGKRVMILGTGETGMDLAYESAKAGAKEVVLCSRAGWVPLHSLQTFVLANLIISF